MRRGFSLLEFLIFCALLLAASTVLLPRALAPRRALNERQATGYLAMIGAAERAWLEETQSYAGLARLCEQPPQRPGMPDSGLSALLAPDFLVDDSGVGHRGGYRFALGRDAQGRIHGCWARPNLRGFSGETSYWADFARGEVRSAPPPPPQRDPPPPPDPSSLGAELLASF
jgi:type II secretory pathway pseudopilin PulG